MPLFSDVLKVVAGRVPLIVEYKIDGSDWTPRCEELMEKATHCCRRMRVRMWWSRSIRWRCVGTGSIVRRCAAASLIEPLPLGQTDVTYWAAGRLLFNWLSRPDFVACDWRSGGSPQVRLNRALGAVPVSWTVRSRDEVAECDAWFDHHIFESFIPDEH